jgi:2,3-bisphosphoglycerate-dependent phosphoglycerate mutase
MNLFLIRHGESLANCARHKAEAEHSLTIDFDGREQDVSLSAHGKLQAENAGKFFANQPNKPNIIFSSPYTRTRETGEHLIKSANLTYAQLVYDERLRERELGIFDGLTKLGAIKKYPDECAKREHYGKFYYRPTGGENWADVALRVRSFWRDLRQDFADENVLIVTHEVVIRVFRYVLETLTEAEILAIDKSCDVENGAITSYKFANGKAVLDLDNFLPK